MLRQSHAILLLCLLAGSSHAGVVTLTPTDVGSYGRTSFFTGSYDVAALDGLPELDFRNYAIFDLSGINGTIVEAQLVTDTGADVARFNNVTISLQSYGDSISALSDGTANFASLGSGTEYASFTVLASAPAQSPLAINLNQNAIRRSKRINQFICNCRIPTRSDIYIRTVFGCDRESGVTCIDDNGGTGTK